MSRTRKVTLKSYRKEPVRKKKVVGEKMGLTGEERDEPRGKALEKLRGTGT